MAAPQAEAGPAPVRESSTWRLVLPWAMVAGAIAVIGGAGLLLLISMRGAEPPPRLGQVPPFMLTASDGDPISRGDLEGSPWVADFIFTRCTGICPMLNIRMQALQEALPEDSEVRLVSISVDPQHDTPQVLADYARRNRAEAARWLFLTGEWDEIRSLVGDGFKLGVSQSDPAEVEEGELVTHSDRLVLVDGQGEIRGYYHGTDEGSVSRILEDLQRIGG